MKDFRTYILSKINPILEKSLRPKQHGFRKGIFCTTQLVTTCNEIMVVVDKEISVYAAVLDFFKAFDKISHSLLIDKF